MTVRFPAPLLCVLLVACAAQPAAPPDVEPGLATNNTENTEPAAAPFELAPAPAPEPAPDLSTRMLKYHQALRRMPQADLARELASLGQQEKSPTAALLSAMVLMNLRASDPARAQAQLDLVLNAANPQAQELKPLAHLLAAHLAETRRLSETADKLSVQVKEGQRRVEQLNEMLEGLKAIERTLPARPPARPAPLQAPAKWSKW
jgi:hypothetical protein